MSRPRRESPWECVVVGAGPAGLSAAIYMGRFKRRTLVVDAGDGRWCYGQRNDNYLGFPNGVGAKRLHTLGRAQAERFGVTFEDATVTAVRLEKDQWRLDTTLGLVRSSTLIWATGVRDRWPDFPRARRLIGRQLFWCIVCDGWRARGKAVVVLGDDDPSARTTLQLLTYTDRLTLLVDPSKKLSARTRRRLESVGIPVRSARIACCHLSDGKLASVELEDGNCLDAGAIFSLLGNQPRTELLRGLPIALARNEHVVIDDKNHTSHPMFFAAGDVTNKHSHQVVSAAHEGSMAAQAANHMLYPPRQEL
jgi:thioredoxin reductase (NADPH)